jgi:hypothetical protein
MQVKKKQQREDTQIVDSMYWWLRIGRPFIINNEYKIEYLGDLKRNPHSVKIKITNLKTNTSTIENL